MIEQTVRAVASRGPFLASDVAKACQSNGVRMFSGAEIGETLRALESAGEIVPSGTYVDPTTRKVLFRTGPARPPRVSQEEGEFRAFASMLGLDDEPVRTVKTSGGAPVVRRQVGVSAAEQAEYDAWAATFGGDL